MAISGSYSAGDEITLNDASVQIRIGTGGSFVESNTWISTVSFEAQTRDTSTLRLLGASNVVGVSALGSGRATVTCVYTEGATDLFQNIYDEHTSPSNSSQVDILTEKNGATTGDDVFTSSGGKLVSCTPPSPSAEDSNAVTIEFVIEYASLGLTAKS